MIDAATAKPPMFDVIVMRSFSRFFRDQFQLEFYVRRLAKNGVRLISITQELGDAIENGVTDLSDMMLKDRIAELKAIGDQARADAERGRGRNRTTGSDHHAAIDQGLRQNGPQADADRERRLPPRLPARARQRVEVDAQELRMMGSKSELLRTLVAASSA